jgi:hypothetical protein
MSYRSSLRWSARRCSVRAAGPALSAFTAVRPSAGLTVPDSSSPAGRESHQVPVCGSFAVRRQALLILAFLLSSVTCGVASADIINVPGDYASIQAAIAAAQAGDEIIVAPGTYNEAIDFLGKAVYLHSSDGADLTTIDSTGLEASVVVCMSGELPDTIIEGFTITGGTGTYEAWLDRFVGGAMANFYSDPTVNNCIFTGNTAYYGGGMYNEGASPTVTNCMFTNNEAGDGGGMYNHNASHPKVADCTFADNLANHGGGMCNWFYSNPILSACIFSGHTGLSASGMYNGFYSSPIVEECEFIQNHGEYGCGAMANMDHTAPIITGCLFLENTSGYSGAAICNCESTPTVEACTFEGNWADQDGGAIENQDSDPEIDDCRFLLNEAGAEGGAIRNIGANPVVVSCTFSENTAPDGGAIANIRGDCTVVNCLFHENSADRGGGIACSDSEPTVVNCTFAGNAAGHGRALSCASDGHPSAPALANCILWNGGDEVWNDDGSTIAITYSDIRGGYGGEGNIDTDPLFVDPVSDDFHLSTDSPCTDAGDNTAVPEAVTTDLDTNPRFVDNPFMPDTGFGTPPIVDMGAYEFPSGSGDPVTYHVEPGDSIQAVIAIASGGDEIIVAPGTYHEAIDFLGKAIHLQSSDGPAVTILDGSGLGGSVVVCMSDEGPGTILEGFTITGGTGTYEESLEEFIGGGMANVSSSPTVNDCIFTENTADYGAGMANFHLSSPDVTNCAFIGNTADRAGGGLTNYGLSSPTITNCLFSGNTSFSMGGGLANKWRSSPTVAECTFTNNLAVSDTDQGIGGGLVNSAWCLALIIDCMFTGNVTGPYGSGGGLANNFSDRSTVVDCVFTDNFGGGGGGVFNGDYGLSTVVGCTFAGNSGGFWGGGGLQNYHGHTSVINCLFHGNWEDGWGGGGIQNDYDGTTTVVNCTLALNEAAEYGGGVSNYQGIVFLNNCVLWNNTALFGPEIDGVATVSYCCVDGGYAGEGNIDADPLFADPDNGNFHLSPGSPCIDAADNASVPADLSDLDDDGDTEEPIPFDLDGNPRFVDDPETEDTGNGEPPIVDMGAYEYQGPGCPADFDGDGDVDTADLLILLGAWGTPAGDVDGDGDTDAADLLALLAAWGNCPR